MTLIGTPIFGALQRASFRVISVWSRFSFSSQSESMQYLRNAR
jgi:hypothetical protein